MNKYCLSFCLLLAASLIQADTIKIYKWEDSSGIVHFSDKPSQGAELIEIPKIQSYSSPKPTAPELPSIPIAAVEDIGYKKIKIVQPEDQVTIRNPQGYVSVLVDVEPKLKPGDLLQILYDGSPVGEPQPSTVFALQDVTRGSHTLSAQVLNAQGGIIATTEPITIYMMPPRVGMVPGTRVNP